MSSPPPSPILCVLEVYYSATQNGRLTIRADSDPANLAKHFATTHNLSAKYRVALEKHIRTNKEAVTDKVAPPATTLPRSDSVIGNYGYDAAGNLLAASVVDPPPLPPPLPTPNTATGKPVKPGMPTPNNDNPPRAPAAHELQTTPGPPLTGEALWSSIKKTTKSPTPNPRSTKPRQQSTTAPKVPRTKQSKKAAKIRHTATRLHNLHAAIKTRHETHRSCLLAAESSYLRLNAFGISESTRLMAARRTVVAFGGKGATGTVDVKDVGARLHMEAALVRRKQEEMSAVARFREGEEEMVGCTWTPELSVGTVMQTSERVTMSDNIFDHLYMKSVQDEDKFKYYESIAGVSEEDTGKPIINKRSEEIVKEVEQREMRTGCVNRDYSNSAVGEEMFRDYDSRGDDMLRDMELMTKQFEDTATVNTQIPKYQKLYENRHKKAASIKNIKDNLPTTDADECTFHPNIGSNQVRMIEDASTKDFVNRLHGEHDVILKKKEKVALEQAKDWFQPETGRSPLNARNVDNLPIHEHLYNEDKKTNVKKAVVMGEAEKVRNDKMTFKVLPMSERLLGSVKRKACEELFRVLLATIDFKKSSEGNVEKSSRAITLTGMEEMIMSFQMEEEEEEDEEKKLGEMGGEAEWRSKLLDTTKCDAELLDEEVCKIVRPILTRHVGTGEGGMSLDNFCDLVVLELDRVGVESLGIIRSLRSKQKDVARRGRMQVEMEKKKVAGEESAVTMFHPEINRKSRQIMKQRRQSGRGLLLFSTLHHAQKIFMAKRKVLVKQHQAVQDEECTFKPTLVSNYKGTGRYRMGV